MQGFELFSENSPLGTIVEFRRRLYDALIRQSNTIVGKVNRTGTSDQDLVALFNKINSNSLNRVLFVLQITINELLVTGTLTNKETDEILRYEEDLGRESCVMTTYLPDKSAPDHDEEERIARFISATLFLKDEAFAAICSNSAKDELSDRTIKELTGLQYF